VRIKEDIAEMIDSNYEQITGTDKEVSDRELFEKLVELAISKVKPRIEDKKLIAELRDKIETLSNDNVNLGNAINSMNIQHEQECQDIKDSFSSLSDGAQGEIDRQKAIIKSKSDKIAELEEHIRVSADIPEDMMLVNVTENEKKVFDLVTAMIREKTQKDVSAGGMLKSVFFDVVRFGPTTHLMGVNPSWNQIKEILTSAKQPSPSGD